MSFFFMDQYEDFNFTEITETAYTGEVGLRKKVVSLVSDRLTSETFVGDIS